MSRPKRYHPLLVILHWLSALLVMFMLFSGMFSLKQMPNTPDKIPALALHMGLGIAILLLTVLRILVRLSTRLPAPATTGYAVLDVIGRVTHILLYVGMIGMGISGMGVASQAGLFESVFERSGAPLPEDFFVYPPRYGHGYLALALLALIGLHIAAAFYHQFIRRDGLLARMGFERRNKRE
ncbi:MAG: cytochrome b/b6 domain-containing protein [Anaerolineales bacterium]|nr:cytochrome b/b6 domain-containing protein [Anaerolineales bacterium]